MRILLDTNIIIHREASRVLNEEIGTLFGWFDRLQYEKCIHPLSIDEIRKHADPIVVKTIEAKVKNYNLLKTVAPENEAIQAIRQKYDRTENDAIDTSLLKEVFSKRIDFLITEDRGVHRKAIELGISERVFSIDDFLDKATTENPELSDYKVLSVRRAYFGDINIDDPFFDSFKKDYVGFSNWFAKKSDEVAYICKSESDEILAFLYLKDEGAEENYSDIYPSFKPKKRLKIGTFKVVLNGYKLGERFVKIIFDNAIKYNVDEIYVTLFNNTPEHKRLNFLLEDWGFQEYGYKDTSSGREVVLTRDFKAWANIQDPGATYPFISRESKKFIVPIWPDYHTELLPDSILKSESPDNYIENRPYRNAIRKVYISRSINRDLEPGDIVVFYRTRSNSPAYYTAVTTTIGVVESINTQIKSAEDLIVACRKRSVFSDEQLIEQWDWKPSYRPFVVNFLYVYSLPARLNLGQLQAAGIIAQAPRGFEELSDESFMKLMEDSNANMRLVID